MSSDGPKLNKRQRAALFRERLAAASAEAGLNRSALARATGVDRSTLSQLLTDGETRLPGAQLVAECAAALRVSSDWLLGLTDRPERPGELVAASVRESRAARSAVDEQVFRWHEEARGYKIRHVPATLPDMLKTPDMLDWEYGSFLARTPDQAKTASTERLDLLRARLSDHEIAIPVHEVRSLAEGTGYYRSAPREVRRAQIDHIGRECAALFPSLRLFLFDAHRVFSAPMSVYGPILGVVYVGQFYLAFRSEERVRSLTRHFDWLVRECAIDARDVAGFLDDLAVT